MTSGKSSRTKGAVAEREFAAVLRQAGFTAERGARNGKTAEDVSHSVPGVWIECKRCEKLSLPEWLRQAERDCGPLEPVVAFRQSRQPWRVVVLADEWLKLKRMQSVRKEVDRVTVEE